MSGRIGTPTRLVKMNAKQRRQKRKGWRAAQDRRRERQRQIIRECGIGSVNHPVDTTPRLVRRPPSEPSVARDERFPGAGVD